MFNKTLKSAICAVLSVSIAVTSVVPRGAFAQTSGPDLMATASIGGQLIQYPKLTWRPVGVLEIGDDRIRSVDGPAQNSLAAALNTAGEALGMNARDVAAVFNAVPANQPFVVGRTDNFTQTGRVDVFKLQRTATRTELLHARFTPAHGLAWAVNRTYLTDAERSNPNAIGRNPFDAFNDGSGNFRGANVAAMLVAVGHAMKMAGTSNGLLVEIKVQPPVTWQTKRGKIRKTITTHVKYYGKPAYYFSSPVRTAEQAQLVPGICLADLQGASGAPCPSGLLAAAGTTFDAVSGGNLDESTEELAYITESKKTWGWFAMFLVGLMVGYVIGFPIGTPIDGIGLSYKDIGAKILGARNTTVTGMDVNLSETGLGQVGAGFVDYDSTRQLLQTKQTPAMQLPGYAEPQAESNVFTQGLGAALRTRNTQDLHQMIGPARQAVLGTCPLDAPAQGCAGSVGMVDRVDQRTPLNHLGLAADTMRPDAVRPDTEFGDRTDRASVIKVPVEDSRVPPSSYVDVPVTAAPELQECSPYPWLPNYCPEHGWWSDFNRGD